MNPADRLRLLANVKEEFAGGPLGDLTITQFFSLTLDQRAIWLQVQTARDLADILDGKENSTWRTWRENLS